MRKQSRRNNYMHVLSRLRPSKGLTIWMNLSPTFMVHWWGIFHGIKIKFSYCCFRCVFTQVSGKRWVWRGCSFSNPWLGNRTELFPVQPAHAAAQLCLKSGQLEKDACSYWWLIQTKAGFKSQSRKGSENDHSAKTSILTVTIIIVTPHHWQLHLWMVSGGHLSNVWSPSSRWQPGPIHNHPTMTCSYNALSLLKTAENMSNRTLLLLWYVSLVSQHLAVSGVWCVIC